MAVSTDRRQGVNSSAAIKVPCRVATTANITLSGLQTIDGVTLAADDRVLVKDQSTASQNGIYGASSGAWQRTPDFDGTFDAKQGTLIRVNSGTVNGGAWFSITTADPITIGTTSLAFSPSATTPFDSALVSFIQAGAGAVTRTVQARLRDTVHLSDFLGSNTYTQAWQYAVASGAQKLYVDASGTITAQIDIPANMFVTADGGVLVTKGFNGDMFTLASGVQWHDCNIYGNGGTYTGRGFVISTGTDQRILNTNITGMTGYCLEITAVSAASRGQFSGGFWQRQVATNAAIGMPSGEALTDGTRTFEDIYCGGGVLIDLNGSNMTTINNCNTGGINFTANSTQVKIGPGTRVATTTWTIDGSGHHVNGNVSSCNIVIAGTASLIHMANNDIAGTLTLNSGASSCRIDESNTFQGGVTDNSGAVSNWLYYEKDITPTLGADSGSPAVGNGTITGRACRRGKHIRAEIQLTCGSSTALGTGSYFSMPTEFAMTVKRTGVKGSIYAIDSGTGLRTGVTRMAGSAAPKIYMASDGVASLWGATVPITWAANDVIEAEAEWEIG